MPLLDDMGAIRYGTVEIVRVMRGGDEVWPKQPVAVSGVSLWWDTVDLSITPPAVGADRYVVQRDGVQIYDGPVVASLRDTWPEAVLMPSTGYVYTVFAYRGSSLVSEGEAEVTTAARAEMVVTATSPRWDQLSVSWTDPTVRSVDRYDVYVNGTRSDPVAVGTREKLVGTLDPSTTYAVRVDAMRSNVLVASSAPVSKATTALSMEEMTGTAVSASRINLTWTNPGGLTAVRLRDSAGGNQLLAGNATSGNKTGLAAGTSYNFAVDGWRGTQEWRDRAKVDAVKTYQQKVALMSPDYMATYKENDTKNTYNGASSTKFMVGRYDATNGLQKSAFHFPIDRDYPDLRWCFSIDKVEFSVQNDHWANGSGQTVWLAITHSVLKNPDGSDRWATWPGSTGAFAGKFAYLDKWYGGAQTTTTRHWVDITNEVEPNFNETVAKNFRERGAQGICLRSTQTAQGYYGYFRNNPQLRITYTVAT